MLVIKFKMIYIAKMRTVSLEKAHFYNQRIARARD